MADDSEDRGRAAPHEAGAPVWAALGAASRAKADAFLDEQTRLAREQAELARLQAGDLRREDSVRHWSLRVHHIGDVLKLAFQLALAVIFTAFVIVIGGVVWSAAHDNGLVIDAFKVPPDMAAKGLTGDVVASQLLDRLTQMQAGTDSSRAPDTYASNWGTDIKVEIPDTGVSIGEAYRYLVGWLGHQTHISGEVFHSAKGIALTARVGGNPGVTFEGREAQLAELTQSAAASIYHQTQPYRYAIYVGTIGDIGTALRNQDNALRELALTGPESEKPWAYTVWAYSALNQNNLAEALRRAHKGVSFDPDLPLALGDLVTMEEFAGHDALALDAAHRTLQSLDGNGAAKIIARAAAAYHPQFNAFIAEQSGDYGQAISQYREMQSLPDFEGLHWNADFMIAGELALLHNIRASRAANNQTDVELERRSTQAFGWQLAIFTWPAFTRAAELEDWTTARRGLEAVLNMPEAKALPVYARMQISPWLALAQAKTGDFRAAWSLIGKTPTDCYLCVRLRGQIAAAQKDWPQAERWFADAVKQAPSIPFAYSDWGRMLLTKGDFDGAIAKFTIANEKGPHFADPLDMWGEALMVKNRSDLALAKFEEANKYAPHWGRLHLKWGEALWWSGDKEGARKQFAIAAGLDLTPWEKSELARVTHG